MCVSGGLRRAAQHPDGKEDRGYAEKCLRFDTTRVGIVDDQNCIRAGHAEGLASEMNRLRTICRLQLDAKPM